MRKLVSCLLAALICIFPLASLAGDIDAVLTTGSSSYTRGESVTVQLKVTNNTLAPVFSLALALDTPAGFLPAESNPALLRRPRRANFRPLPQAAASSMMALPLN